MRGNGGRALPQELAERARALATELVDLVEAAHAAGWHAGTASGYGEGWSAAHTAVVERCLHGIASLEPAWSTMSEEHRAELIARYSRGSDDPVLEAHFGGGTAVLEELMRWALEQRKAEP